MKVSFRNTFKDYFSFMKKDRNGVLVLMFLIVLTLAGHYIIGKIEIEPHTDFSKMVKAYEEWEKIKQDQLNSQTFFYFNPNTISTEQLDSINLPQFVKNNIIRYREAGGRFKNADGLRKIYGMNDSIFSQIEPWLVFPNEIQPTVKKEAIPLNKPVKEPLDPNSASIEELTRLGFSKFQATNIQKYRDKGGRFHLPEDVVKIYGVDSDLFLSVKEHIQIDEIAGKDMPEEIRVELNSADSLELVKLRGIGPVFAARIIKYRNLLGGFSSADQLLEVYGFPEDTYNQLKESFWVDTLTLKRIRINFAGFGELVRHPYINRNHADAVLKYRDRHGPFSSRQQLLSNELIDSVSYLRIKPYLTCR